MREMGSPIDITKVKLEHLNIPGSGHEIRASFNQEFHCIEFTMRGDVSQPITYVPKDPINVCSEPWIQFAPPEWKAAINSIFEEMVTLWNEKHGVNNVE